MLNDLILQFQKDPSNKQLEQELLNQHKNYIQSHINKWKGVLPDPVMDAYGKKYAIDAFKSYNSSKSNINTHLYNHLSQLSRMVYKSQNTVKIPEQQIQMIGRVNTAKDYLTDQLGREPNVDEVSDYMHLPKKHIAKVLLNQRADFVNDSDSEKQFQFGSQDTEMSHRIFGYRQSLDQAKQQQFDALTGFNQTAPLSPKQFAKKFKMKPYEVSRLKAKFAGEL